MAEQPRQGIQTLELDQPIWDRFFTVAPLVLVGTRDQGGQYNQAPKHMAIPMGWDNYFGFVCTPEHATYQNVVREAVFTVTYPRPTQVVLAALAAAPRYDDDLKPSLLAVPTFPATIIDGRFVKDGYVFLECGLERIVDDFGENSLVTGRIVAAHVHEDMLRVPGGEDQDLILGAPLLAYLEPGRYSRVEQSFAFPYPKDFAR
jgi:flavin reductase (DIM6/NTAB) family NADH-FMN oxidoreductase RutF